MHVIFKKIQNKEIFEDIKKLYVFLENIIINFDLEAKNKKIISNSEEKFYQILIETSSLNIYITYWSSVDYMFIEIYGTEKEVWDIYKYLKDTFNPKYYSISELKNQNPDQD